MSVEIITGDALTVLAGLPAGSVNCCITSPPYYGLRDYGVDGQIGLEATPAEYVARLVEVFREVRRVLADDGTVWLNLGDSYAASAKGDNRTAEQLAASSGLKCNVPECRRRATVARNKQYRATGRQSFDMGDAKPKDLLGIPWRVAFALQADGWYLRSDIIWAKPNPMPESVRDRPTKAHEYLFLLTKRERYWYDADAVKEPANSFGRQGSNRDQSPKNLQYEAAGMRRAARDCYDSATRNRRSVWTITPRPYKGAHFAVMPPELVRPCVRAGCKPGGTVLDPFGGSGTVGEVATQEGRSAVLIELNPAYVELAHKRLSQVEPALFAGVA